MGEVFGMVEGTTATGLQPNALVHLLAEDALQQREVET